MRTIFINDVRVSVYEKDGERLVCGGDVLKVLGVKTKDPHRSRSLARELKEGTDYVWIKVGKIKKVYLTKEGVMKLDGDEEVKDKIIGALEGEMGDEVARGADSYLVDLMEDIDRRLSDLEDAVDDMDGAVTGILSLMGMYQADGKVSYCQALGMLCEGMSGIVMLKNREVKEKLSAMGVAMFREAKRGKDFLDKCESKKDKDGVDDGD